MKHVVVHEPKNRTVKGRSNKNLINYETCKDGKNKNQFYPYVCHIGTSIFISWNKKFY